MTGWEDFAAGLAVELATLRAGSIVKVVESGIGPRRRYAQFLQLDDALSAELVDDEWLDPPLRAGVAGRPLIAESGWRERDAGHSNWWTELAWPSPTTEYRRLADMVVTGLRDGFGIDSPTALAYAAWNERLENRELDLPLLGLRQEQ
ncbi:TY-Chap domain-containing protein [Nocardia sp. R7R-8]|uniref:TY-Chap domain-containing protein n=1 Tax=Nocardia sp. R7R-8 TaxID=3459304 RepID=UPI00403DBC98